MTVLRPVPLSAQAFAPYGRVIAVPPNRERRRINDGNAQRFDLINDLMLHAEGGRPALAVFRAQARRFPLGLRELERHARGSQSFLPLGERRFVVVVAPAGAAPDTDALAAFIADGRQGIWLAPGTWHHALLAVDDGDFAVIERAGPTVDCDVRALAAPVTLVLA